ncbi:serine protease inhibitor 77Ba-like [Euwallacea fornicatus]|uniref:serine protease inhibitor 77Ba-like n=1 Tax=Euwallacea fornicatus TaxID=995702 RepID=UPI00338E162C
MKTYLYTHIGIVLCLAAPAYLQDKFNIADSINKFSLDLLASVNLEGGNNLNIALSPLTIWTLLTIASEGAYDSTADQIDRVLGQPQNKNVVRDSYDRLIRQLEKSITRETEFETSTGLFSRQEFPVKDKFEQIVKQYYRASITPVDFKGNNKEAAEIINKYVAAGTKNRISQLVNSDDVRNAYFVMTTTMYFKGQWQTPFNRTATQKASFLDDRKNKIGEVEMMYQAHPYPYDRIDRINAHAIELPYGFDDTFSMLVLIPRGFQTVTNMLNELTKESITDILAKLEQNHQLYFEDDVHVYLPKFKVVSDFNMDRVLERMGIVDIFDDQKANLLGIFPHYLFLSRIIQKAEIEVDEEGTVASAAASAIFLNRAPPPIVKANRPFAFFIIHKQSGSIIFAGKISNPNTLAP